MIVAPYLLKPHNINDHKSRPGIRPRRYVQDKAVLTPRQLTSACTSPRGHLAVPAFWGATVGGDDYTSAMFLIGGR
jgi:hypothetical protein